MGSVENQNPWSSYENYRDCSLGICSIYCPQFCYLIFPPPPSSDDDSSTPFSPLIIAIIGVLASAFLLVSYYTVVTRYCKRRTDNHIEAEENRNESSPEQWEAGSNGLDESVINKITVCRYEKGGGLIEGTECAVCLSEFQENELLRLLPKCSHAFHLPCIDMWLKSQSNCPLCRAHVIVRNPPAFNTNPYETRWPDDLVLVLDDRERGFRERIVVISGDDRNEEEPSDDDQEGVERFGRSVPFGSFSPQRQILVSDILTFEEIDEYVQVEIDQLWRGIGSLKGECSGGSKSSSGRGKDGRLLRSPVAMKRSVSSGRFMGKVNDEGKNITVKIDS